MLNINCRKKITSAVLTAVESNPLCQIRKSATPIRMKSIVQTGANNQLGGVKNGFFKFAYQVGIAGVVKKEPIMLAPKQIAILIISLMTAINFISIRDCIITKKSLLSSRIEEIKRKVAEVFFRDLQ